MEKFVNTFYWSFNNNKVSKFVAKQIKQKDEDFTLQRKLMQSFLYFKLIGTAEIAVELFPCAF